MKKIDFLPNHYRESYAARAAVIKRWTIVLGISLVIAPLAVYQYLAHLRVVEQFVQVEPAFVLAQAKSAKLAELEEQLRLAHGEAALLAWLSHPWPRSQVLAQIHSPLPTSARLTAIRLARVPKESNAAAAPGRNRAARRAAAEANDPALDESRPHAEKDLLALHQQVHAHDQVVTLEGLAHDTSALHAYVAHLRTCTLFDKSELRSLEAAVGQEHANLHNFEIRLVLASGHALVPTVPASRTAPPSAPAPIAAAHSSASR